VVDALNARTAAIAILLPPIILFNIFIYLF
jgi:hypothetical protein